MKDVYDEILGDINNAVTLHADETGWRVRVAMGIWFPGHGLFYSR